MKTSHDCPSRGDAVMISVLQEATLHVFCVGQLINNPPYAIDRFEMWHEQLSPQRIITQLCSSSQLYVAFKSLSAHCCGFMSRFLTVLLQSHCSHRCFQPKRSVKLHSGRKCPLLHWTKTHQHPLTHPAFVFQWKGFKLPLIPGSNDFWWPQVCNSTTSSRQWWKHGVWRGM